MSDFLLILRLAWRNLGRNKRRAALTAIAVFFGLALAVMQRGLQEGTYDENIRSFVRMASGYVQIQREGYQDNPALRKNVILDGEMLARIASTPGLVNFAPRIQADGLISHGERTHVAYLLGVDAAREQVVSDFAKRVATGTFLDPNDRAGVVLGQVLMKNLNVHLGDSLVVLAQGIDGVQRDMFVHIVGVVKTASTDFDRTVMFLPLTTAQRVLGMEGRVSIVALALGDLRDIPAACNHLRARMPAGTVALAWDEVMPDMKANIEADNASGWLYLAILFVVVAFGILNTMLMSITERSREFGIMLAIGVSNRTLVAVVLIELLLLTVMGLVLGNAAGYAFNSAIITNPIELGGNEMGRMYEEYGFLPILTSSVAVSVFLKSTLFIGIVCLCAGIYPLVRVWRLEPLKGIRYT